QKRMIAPVSLIVSAFAPVADIRLSLTPQLRYDPNLTTENTEGTESQAKKSKPLPSSVSSVPSVVQNETPVIGDTVLLLIDLGRGKNRLGGSILAQTVSQMGAEAPDVDSAVDLKNFWNAIQQLGREKKLLAYHDRSDGGLLATIAKMCFAGHVGVDIELDELIAKSTNNSGLSADSCSIFAQLFSEELGAIIQVRTADLDAVNTVLRAHGLDAATTRIGTLNPDYRLRVKQAGKTLLAENLPLL